MRDSWIRRSWTLGGLWAVLLAGAALVQPVRVEAQPAKPFTLAGAVGIPGGGGPGAPPCNTNPAYLQPVLLFHFLGRQPLQAQPAIPPCPASLVNDPIYVTFNHRGELFVGNRHGNQPGMGSIARFVFDSAGNPVPNGSITDPALNAVHGLAFSPRGELFAASVFGSISRFQFTPHGDAIPNGTIANGMSNIALAFDRKGELFATASDSNVYRYLFDRSTGTAIPNGSFHVPGSCCLHGLDFNHRGELFVGDIGTDTVFRFLFDAAGNPVPNGSLAVWGGPIGVAFSPPGELFVSSHFSGGISRFAFDGRGNPMLKEFTPTPQMGGVAVFPAHP